LPLHPRPEIEALEPCPHGGPNYAELERLGFAPEDVLDFSVSANPFGPPPGVREAFASAAIDRYPDSDSSELRRALAARLHTNPEHIIIGNGSMELIRLIATAYLESKDAIVIPEPTFGEYEVACRIVGSRIVKHRLRPEDNFNLDIAEFIESIRWSRAKAVFLCNPNNPTGRYLSQSDIEKLLTASRDTLVVLDEAYVAFAEDPWPSLDLIKRGNLVILRSMTKDYALAGLRLGYAVAGPDIIESLRKVCPPWNVNAVAQRAGVLALEESGYAERCRDGVLEARDYLVRELAKRGLTPVSTQAHFFMVKVSNAREFRQQLLGHGIMVRDCTSFGLPDYVRIAPRTLPECERLTSAIDEIQK